MATRESTPPVGAFKDLLKRSRAARASREPERRQQGSGSVQLNRRRRLRPPLCEHGDQFSERREIGALRARRRAYDACAARDAGASSRRPPSALVALLGKWQELEDEFTQTLRKRSLHARQQLKRDWDEWLRHRNPALYKQIHDLLQRRMDLYEWFCLLDADGSGEISTYELVDPMLTIGLCESEQEVELLVAGVDEDGSGEIGFEEFLSIICADPAASAREARRGADGPATAPKRNAIVQLYKVAAQGELGGDCLHFSSKLTSFRRRVILRALAPRPADYGTEGRAHDQRCVDALQALDVSKRYSGAR